MGHTYTQQTIKLLFGTATHCAYPDCTVPLVFEDRGRRTVAVQIAHIRSAKPGGPRHDPHYESRKLNTDENLLLLCNGPHHDHVDKHEDAYTVEELLDWKRQQIAQGGGCKVSDGEIEPLVRRLEEFIAALKEVNVIVELRGGLGDATGLTAMPLSSLSSATTSNSDGVRYLGIRAENHGLLPIVVEVAGIELDVGTDVHPRYQFTSRFTQCPLDWSLEPHGAGEWFAHQDEIRNVVLELGKVSRRVPTGFRAFVRIGTGLEAASSWTSVLRLPMWEPGVTEDHLDKIRSRGLSGGV